MDDIPSFSSASPISTPVSPSSSRFFLNHRKASEGHGGGGQSPSLAFNNNNNNSLGSAAHRSCMSLSSNPSPVFKSRTVVSSLSFNRGTMNKPAIHNNGSSVTRAASFQSRLNPNGYSLTSGPGSDNDSLHSSTSSLEYPGGFGGVTHLSKMGSYSSPPSQVEYYRIQPQIQQQHIEGGVNLGSTPGLKKFSSHGSVFHSEMDQRPVRMLGDPESQEVNHGSMSSLDLQIRDGGGGMVGLQRAGGRVSPGMQYANLDAKWNVNLHNATFFGVEGYNGSENHCQQQGSQLIKAPQPKVKEIPRLNKFPLDLDSFVSQCSYTSPTKSQGRSMSPNPPKPTPRSTGSLHHHNNSPSTSTSPSASLSSLDSSSDTPPFSLNHPFLPFSPRSPTPSQGSIPVPEMSGSPVSLYSAQSPKLGILSRSQAAQLNPSSPESPSIPRTIHSLGDGAGDASDSVGSILQRIASFSQSVVTDTTQVSATQPPIVQSKGWLPSALGSPAETMPMPLRKQKKQEGKSVFKCLKCSICSL